MIQIKKARVSGKTPGKPARRARKAPASPATEIGPAKPKPRRLDWERIERDHATGRFTDEELASLHKTNRTTISQRRTRDRAANPAAWPVDRTRDVQRATAALLMQEGVDATLAKGDAAEAVLAVAQLSKGVILEHRHEVKRARAVGATLMAELADVSEHRHSIAKLLESASAAMDEAAAAALAAQVRELVKLHARASTLQKLTDSMQRAQVMERKAFGISDDDGGSNPLDSMTEAELEAEIERLTLARTGGAG